MKLTNASILVLLLTSYSIVESNPKIGPTMKLNNMKTEVATFGAGCFWCVEAIFQSLKGVEKVVSGYSGGKIKNPSYREVSSGLSGHAEVVQITYYPDIIAYKELLEVFWQTHDPTTLNRQGADVGTQYRSVIYYHDEEQKNAAEFYKQELTKAGVFLNPIITEIKKFEGFFIAEEYHQNYFMLNSDAPYCNYVIKPKMEKFKKAFAEKYKKAEIDN
jgi:peptide-methionine (S)-S-oxide reductase